MIKKIRKNDLMFHSVHGLCRVAEIPKAGALPADNYSFVPVFQSRSKARFTVSREFLETAGFNKLISAKEANEILEYFKTGTKKSSALGGAWELAVLLREESLSKEPMRDKRRAQKVNHSAKRLSSEMAIVLQSTVREMADKILENLEAVSKTNPMVLAALENVDAL